MSPFGIVLFHSYSAALRADKVLSRSGRTVKLIPTPRELSSDCGIALRFPGTESESIRTQLAAARVDMASIHTWQGGKWI